MASVTMAPGSRNSSPVLVPRQRSAALRLLVFFLLLALPPCSSTPKDRFLQVSGPMQPATNGTEPLTPTTTLCRLDDLIDATLLPDFWNNAGVIDPRIRTNGDTPEQLVKVTDRRHRFPVFATVCSLAFLLTIIAIIVVCTH